MCWVEIIGVQIEAFVIGLFKDYIVTEFCMEDINNIWHAYTSSVWYYKHIISKSSKWHTNINWKKIIMSYND